MAVDERGRDVGDLMEAHRLRREARKALEQSNIEPLHALVSQGFVFCENARGALFQVTDVNLGSESLSCKTSRGNTVNIPLPEIDYRLRLGDSMQEAMYARPVPSSARALQMALVAAADDNNLDALKNIAELGSLSIKIHTPQGLRFAHVSKILDIDESRGTMRVSAETVSGPQGFQVYQIPMTAYYSVFSLQLDESAQRADVGLHDEFMAAVEPIKAKQPSDRNLGPLKSLIDRGCIYVRDDRGALQKVSDVKLYLPNGVLVTTQRGNTVILDYVTKLYSALITARSFTSVDTGRSGTRERAAGAAWTPRERREPQAGSDASRLPGKPLPLSGQTGTTAQEDRAGGTGWAPRRGQAGSDASQLAEMFPPLAESPAAQRVQVFYQEPQKGDGVENPPSDDEAKRLKRPR